MRQVPIFYACPLGHLSEIDFAASIEHSAGCSGNRIKLSFKSRVEHVSAKCLDCGSVGMPKDMPCSGRTPWLPGSADSPCTQEMSVVSRTSIKSYFPTTRSAIHIPTTADLRQDVIDWMFRSRWDVLLQSADEATILNSAQSLCSVLGGLTQDQAVAHIRHLLGSKSDEDSEWNILASRAKEFDVLAGRRRDAIVAASDLLNLEDVELQLYGNPLVQRGHLLHITTVHKLTESRVLSGFSRIEPRVIAPREGRLQMWGRDTSPDDWLPGYRAHGEGIFLVFNPRSFDDQGSHESTEAQSLFELSTAGRTIHTLAHLLILLIAEESGYPVPSLRDRLYDLDDGRLGVLIYTAEGDSMGTLGGLASLAQPNEVDRLVERLIDSGARCPQDPVCREQSLDVRRHISASCHQCTLLPETSCELFNSDLDRRLIQRLFIDA